MTGRDRLERLARRWLEVWEHGDVSVLDELHASEFTDHDPGGRASDHAGFVAGVVAFRAAFPDLRVALETLVIDEAAGRLAVGWSAEGAHRGAYLVAEPSGRTIRFEGIEVLTVREGRIVERWGQWDGMGLLAQLGRWSP